MRPGRSAVSALTYERQAAARQVSASRAHGMTEKGHEANTMLRSRGQAAPATMVIERDANARVDDLGASLVTEQIVTAAQLAQALATEPARRERRSIEALAKLGVSGPRPQPCVGGVARPAHGRPPPGHARRGNDRQARGAPDPLAASLAIPPRRRRHARRDRRSVDQLAAKL